MTTPNRQPLDQPTRRTIEVLFRSLLGHQRDEDTALGRAYLEARDEEDKLEEKLMAHPRLQALKRKHELAYEKHYRAERARKEKVVVLHRLYLANGITKELVKELNKLIKQ